MVGVRTDRVFVVVQETGFIVEDFPFSFDASAPIAYLGTFVPSSGRLKGRSVPLYQLVVPLKATIAGTTDKVDVTVGTICALWR